MSLPLLGMTGTGLPTLEIIILNYLPGEKEYFIICINVGHKNLAVLVHNDLSLPLSLFYINISGREGR